MQEAEQGIIRCQGDWSHIPCPWMPSGTKPALWSATGCDINSHFHRLWVASHPYATWEFLGVISSCYCINACLYMQGAVWYFLIFLSLSYLYRLTISIRIAPCLCLKTERKVDKYTVEFVDQIRDNCIIFLIHIIMEVVYYSTFKARL